MSAFPSGVYDPRTKNNKEGIIYNPALDTQLFVEDVNGLDNEVVAIENSLGLYALKLWSALLGTYVSASTFTFVGTAVESKKIIGSLFSCLDNLGTTRRIGYVKSASHNTGVVTVTVVTDTNLAANDKDFFVTPNKKVKDYMHLITRYNELVADNSNSIGEYELNIMQDSYLLPVDFAVITAGQDSGTGVLTINIYKDATAMFSSAPDMVEANILVEQRPDNTNEISVTDNISLRIMAIDFDTVVAADFQARLFIVPQSLFTLLDD